MDQYLRFCLRTIILIRNNIHTCINKEAFNNIPYFMFFEITLGLIPYFMFFEMTLGLIPYFMFFEMTLGLILI